MKVESSRVVFIGRLSWRPLSFDPPALNLPCIGRCCFRLRHCRRRSGRRVIVRKRKQIVFPPLRELHIQSIQSIQSIHKYFPIRRVFHEHDDSGRIWSGEWPVPASTGGWGAVRIRTAAEGKDNWLRKRLILLRGSRAYMKLWPLASPIMLGRLANYWTPR